LTFTVDQGEAEAITLAIQESALLLIDESKGRLAATSAVLIRAKELGLIDSVGEVLVELTEIGYHFSIALQQQILKRSGE
jgi:predicted nucleic acid-binding protein